MLRYQEIPTLAAVVLEESYVLDIGVRPGAVEFTMEFVLTPEHEGYQEPGPEDAYCYRRGRLTFSGVTSCLWSNQGAPPAQDATGEIDFGNIDWLEWDESEYRLEGDWGRMELVASGAEAIME